MRSWKLTLILGIFMTQALYATEKWCFIGDTGLEGQTPRLVAVQMRAVGCTQVFVTGDIIYPNGIRGANDESIKTKFLNHFQALGQEGVPFYLVMGNHDARGSEKAWQKVAKSYDWLNFPKLYYAFSQGDLCFVNLNTNPNYVRRKAKQKKWLYSEYKVLKNDGCKLSIAVGHHPYKSAGKHGDATGKRAKFLKKHIIGKVDFYIAGHDHNLSDEGEFSGTRLLVSGSGASLRPVRSNADAVFAVSKLGFISLEREDSSYGVNGIYKIYAMESENSPAVPVYSARVLGQGIRN